MEQQEMISEISAETVTLEVVDKKTGRSFRRELPIDYFENINGIRLGGEDIQGRPVQLAFYSDSALSRLKDLTGGGPDKDPCGTHS